MPNPTNTNLLQDAGKHVCCKHCKGEEHYPHTSGCPVETDTKGWGETVEITAECCEGDKDCTEDRIEAIRELMGKAHAEGVKSEKEAWRSGLRCDNCGSPMIPKDRLNLVCSKCYEEA